MALIYHSQEDNCFGCNGCFDRIEIPKWVNDPFVFVTFRESVEQEHADRGCSVAMEKLEGMAYRGNRLALA